MHIETFLEKFHQLNDLEYWRKLNPESTISCNNFGRIEYTHSVSKEELDSYSLRLREEGYCQTNKIIPTAMTKEMQECIENVKKAGFPPIFALVYDVFWQALASFNSTLKSILGGNWLLIPNVWFYYIDNNDDDKGFEPHTDSSDPSINEYLSKARLDLFDTNSMPKIITIWITVTDANPLNSCIYIVPINRDRGYANLSRHLVPMKRNVNCAASKGNFQEDINFDLQDIRAIPTQAGTLSCWNPYVIHWGSRSSKFAQYPRISIAAYCQRDNIPLIEDMAISISSEIDFKTRINVIYRGVARYEKFHL